METSCEMKIKGIYNHVRNNKLKTLKEIIIMEKIDVNGIVNAPQNHTLLHEAVILNKFEIFLMLLEHGADINKLDSTGSNALTKAVALGRMNMVRELVSRGANLDIKDEVGRDILEIANLYDRFELHDYLKFIIKK